MGIEVSGSLSVAIKMPVLYGSYEYVPLVGERVVLVALDPASLTIVPVGVGRVDVQQNRVVSEKALTVERLDILGYARVNPTKQETLKQFAEGEITLARLTAALAQ